MRLTVVLRLALGATLLGGLSGCSTTVTVGDQAWTAECGLMTPDDCEGVTRLFVNNLARSGGWIHDESGGRVRVSPATCPAHPHPDVVAYLDLSACWRADAPLPDGRACMLIARQKDPATVGFPFGQAGGDNYTGLIGAPEPGTTPC
jgi:hypothetical protein